MTRALTHACRTHILAALVANCLAGTAAAGEPQPAETPRLGTLEASRPCAFFHGQAYHKGLTHYATEMLWACETIAERGAARMPLGERLAATEAAIRRYRDAVLAAGRTAFAETRTHDIAPRTHGLSEMTKRRLAEETGALAALEAIRTGY